MGTLRAVIALPLACSVLTTTLAASCGAPRRAPDRPLPNTTQRTYAPLTIKADAKDVHQAVILGTDERNGSTVLRLPSATSKGLVDALFVRLGAAPGEASGGQTLVKLATAPNGDGTVQVGVYEELAGGTGSQWRAGVWVSAFVAAQALGKDLTDFQFSAASGGYIDGASASGLMAGGFLATITGEAIDPTVSMTGIINPDGTIGPVSGIPEKFLGAIAKGKKRLGYPIGMRFARSEATGKDVDLVELARAGGAEAVEVATVQDAFRLLTGKRLPEPLPVPEAEMALDEDTVKAIDLKYKGWQERLGEEWAALLQLAQRGRLPPHLATMAERARDAATDAERLHRQGLVAGAYAKMLAAWVYAASATSAHDVIAKVQSGDVAGALDELTKLEQLDQITAEVFQRIGAIKPATLGGHLLMIASFQAALRSWGFKVFASESLAQTRQLLAALGARSPAELADPEITDALAERIAPTVLLLGQTVASALLASEELEFMTEKSVNYVCSIPNIKRLSTSFHSAGAAGVNYFETLLVEPLAKEHALPVEQVRLKLAMIEPDYLVAYMLSRLQAVDGLPAQLRAQWGETSPAWSLLSLAGSELAYYNAAELVAKYYSLGIDTDLKAGSRGGVAHDKAFASMLANAERQARASARAARIATGSIPVQAKLAYQQATIAREGDASDKLDALSQFWMASAYSQTAVMLARN